MPRFIANHQDAGRPGADPPFPALRRNQSCHSVILDVQPPACRRINFCCLSLRVCAAPLQMNTATVPKGQSLSQGPARGAVAEKVQGPRLPQGRDLERKDFVLSPPKPGWKQYFRRVLEYQKRPHRAGRGAYSEEMSLLCLFQLQIHIPSAGTPALPSPSMPLPESQPTELSTWICQRCPAV